MRKNIWKGFAPSIVAASIVSFGTPRRALRGVPKDTIEAATIDGANPFQMFFRIKLPQIFSTVMVVWTTLVILVLKVFDIPYALSANDDDKLLLASNNLSSSFADSAYGISNTLSTRITSVVHTTITVEKI